MKQNINPKGERKPVDVSYFKILGMQRPPPKFVLSDAAKELINRGNSDKEKQESSRAVRRKKG